MGKARATAAKGGMRVGPPEPRGTIKEVNGWGKGKGADGWGKGTCRRVTHVLHVTATHQKTKWWTAAAASAIKCKGKGKMDSNSDDSEAEMLADEIQEETVMSASEPKTQAEASSRAETRSRAVVAARAIMSASFPQTQEEKQAQAIIMASRPETEAETQEHEEGTVIWKIQAIQRPTPRDATTMRMGRIYIRDRDVVKVGVEQGVVTFTVFIDSMGHSFFDKVMGGPIVAAPEMC